MFEDLELPDLERKALRQIEAFRMSKRKGYRSVGIRIRLDKRRTARERARRRMAVVRAPARRSAGLAGGARDARGRGASRSTTTT